MLTKVGVHHRNNLINIRIVDIAMDNETRGVKQLNEHAMLFKPGGKWLDMSVRETREYHVGGLGSDFDAGQFR